VKAMATVNFMDNPYCSSRKDVRLLIYRP